MAGLGDAPSFDGLLESNQPKDTEIVIEEEHSSNGAPQTCDNKRKRGTPANTITVHAHWVVLWSQSSYFRNKLERWSEGDDSKQAKQRKQHGPDQENKQQQYQYSMQLLVPPGQLELGRRLITAMYSSSPDLSDLEAPQLMQLVTLADCYGVGKGVTAAAAQLGKLSVPTMPLETAAAVFELPEACLALDAFKGVRVTASSVLRQELGDLEVVWGDQQQQQQLLGLPLSALLQVLKDSGTQVASEDTAVYTAARWLEANPGGTTGGGGRAADLVSVLRLVHCTPTFLSSSDLDSCVRQLLCKGGITDQEVMQLCAMSGANNARRASWLSRECQHRPAWQLPCRPASSVKQLTITWQLPLSDIEEALLEKDDDSGTAYLRQEEEVLWCGREWSLGLCLVPDGKVWLHLVCWEPAAACCNVQLQVMHTNRINNQRLQDGYTGGPQILGRRMFEWGADKAWPQVVEWLREQSLVHPGDKLHLGCVVTNVS